MRQILFLMLATFSLSADPPGATVRTKLQVPAALNKGNFAQDHYLNVPPGFQISLYAIVSGARFMALAPNGDILVSQNGAGKILLLRPDPKGGVPQQFTFASGLNSPQGMAFSTIAGATWFYFAEAQQVSRAPYTPGDTALHNPQIIVPNLPQGGSHPLKNIALDSTGHLYVALGSSCNVCASDTVSNPQRGAIYQYDAAGNGGRLFAQGLRNAEGLAFLPGANQLWVVMNNRDDIPYPVKDSSGNYGKVIPSYVDNHPPDLFTAVRDGGNYGWPFCDSNPDNGLDRMPFNPDYDVNSDGHVDCAAMDIPDKGIQAHSAPLGLAFLQGSGFAAPYRNGAVAGLHGSWDRTTPTGYKVIWYAMNPTPGAALDLVTGWLDPTTLSAWGRPVAAVPDSQGALLITDDLAGAVYRLTYSPLVAPESITSVYGTHLTTDTASATSPQWPTALAGVSVTITDSKAISHAAPVAYVSPQQINFEIPAGTAAGLANVSIQSPVGLIDQGNLTVANLAPSLFAANGNGAGVAAALTQNSTPVYSCPAGAGTCVAVPIDVSSGVYLSLFGTGIRNFDALDNVQVLVGGARVPVVYAGPQGVFTGLDQVNVQLPASLKGKGLVDVVLIVDGLAANTVQIAIQ